jgi:hypothetical protein
VLQICLTMVGRGEGSTPPPALPATAKGWEAYGITAPRTVAAPFVPPPVVRGGVLIFFPSYAAMESTCARWRESGVYDRLRSAVGSVLMEPKGSSSAANNSAPQKVGAGMRYSTSGGVTYGNNASASNNFMFSGGKKAKSAAGDDDDNAEEGGAEFRSIVGQFEHAIKTYGGCVLLAVCR